MLMGLYMKLAILEINPNAPNSPITANTPLPTIYNAVSILNSTKNPAEAVEAARTAVAFKLHFFWRNNTNQRQSVVHYDLYGFR